MPRRRLTKFEKEHREEIRKLQQSVIEFACYFNYEKENRRAKFEARAYLTLQQIQTLGGLENLYRLLEYLLYDALDIYTFEWDSGVIGYQHVEREPTKFGTWVVHDVNEGRVYQGSMKYAYGRRVRNVYG
jgi:hypothetical protein